MRLFDLAHLTTLAFLLLAEEPSIAAALELGPYELGHTCLVEYTCIDPKYQPKDDLYQGVDTVWLHLPQNFRDEQRRKGTGKRTDVAWGWDSEPTKGLRVSVIPGTLISQPDNWDIRWKASILLKHGGENGQPDPEMGLPPLDKEHIVRFTPGAVEAARRQTPDNEIPTNVERPAIGVTISYEYHLPRGSIDRGVRFLQLPPGQKGDEDPTATTPTTQKMQIKVGGPGAALRGHKNLHREVILASSERPREPQV